MRAYSLILPTNEQFLCRNKWGTLVECIPGNKKKYHFTTILPGYVGLSLFNGDGTKVLDASWNDRIVDLQPLQKLQDQSWFIEWPEATEVKNRWKWFKIYRIWIGTKFYFTLSENGNKLSLEGMFFWFDLYHLQIMKYILMITSLTKKITSNNHLFQKWNQIQLLTTHQWGCQQQFETVQDQKLVKV